MGATLPRGPRSRVLTSWGLIRDPYGFWLDARRRHGDTFMARAWNGDILCTGDPAVIADLFRTDHTQTRPFRPELFGDVLGRNGLLTLEGEAHRAERRVLTPPFRADRTRAFARVMQRIAEERMAAWPTEGEVVAADEMLAISLMVIVRAVFGIEDADEARAWADDVAAMVASIDPIFLFFPVLQRLPTRRWRRFQEARATLDARIRAEVERRRTTGERGEDILSTYLDSTYEDGSHPTADQVRDELVTLLFAGHETTQIAMSWALYHVARDPEVYARLREELDGCDGSAEAFAKLPWLGAVVDETLRLVPIVPDMLRTTTKLLVLGGYEVPEGTHVAFVAAMVHTRPDLYPEPERFRPQRFLERSFKPHELIPFGGGGRRCIGAHFATIEARVVLGTVLRAFDIRSLSEEEPVRRNVTMGVRHGVRLHVQRRHIAVESAA
ncbi:MAG: cytochrome P450 [Alphaproteobacteria bacterium]|nr:cytochrome P450 [Alphaproteobacteria bacterium]